MYKNNTLLSAVEVQIQTNQRMLCVFLSALNEDPSMQSLVESMESDYICEGINPLLILRLQARKHSLCFYQL